LKPSISSITSQSGRKIAEAMQLEIIKSRGLAGWRSIATHQGNTKTLSKKALIHISHLPMRGRPLTMTAPIPQAQYASVLRHDYLRINLHLALQ
jgi:hypothetical protein